MGVLTYWQLAPAERTSGLFIFQGKSHVRYLLARVLAGLAQWIEHQPANLKAAGSVPRQGACQDCGPGPRSGVYLSHMDVSLHSLSFSLPFPVSKNK